MKSQNPFLEKQYFAKCFERNQMSNWCEKNIFLQDFPMAGQKSRAELS